MYKILRNTSLYIIILIVGAAGEPNAAPLVRVKEGLVSGVRDVSLNGKEFYSYFRIPYAKPPVGELRFKDPVPHDSWEGILDGSLMPEVCSQDDIDQSLAKNTLNFTFSGTEDCLYMNVFTPMPNSPEAKLPVMFFIHGGAFITGGANLLSPNVLLEKDIVLIVIQYRLGVLGFLSTEDAMLPGNMGLKDQQLALKWVRANIRQFGGDPDSVTLFGESAGAASVHYQILSPGSKGLFKRAILQSGNALAPWASNEGHRDFAIKLGDHFDCPLREGEENFVKCLQKIDDESLIMYTGSFKKWGFGPLFVLPRADGDFLPEPAEEMMTKGNYNDVDLIIGTTKDEGAFLMLLFHVYPSMLEKLNKNFKEFGPISLYLENHFNGVEAASEIYKYYLGTDDIFIRKNDENIMKLFSDSYFNVANDIVSQIFARDEEVKLFTYTLDHVGNISILNNFAEIQTYKWVSHVDDLLYLFNFPGLPQELTESDSKLREYMVSMWTNFAKYGNPTPPGSDFTWERVTPENFNHLSIATPPTMKPDNFKKEREFWKQINEKIRKGSLKEDAFKEAKQEL